MEVPDEIRARTKRLLEGRANSHDLDRLFLWLREKPYGYWIVKEIGDFAAHWEERGKGITFQHATRMFRAISLTPKLISRSITPTDLVQPLRASFDQEPPEETFEAF